MTPPPGNTERQDTAHKIRYAIAHGGLTLSSVARCANVARNTLRHFFERPRSVSDRTLRKLKSFADEGSLDSLLRRAEMADRRRFSGELITQWARVRRARHAGRLCDSDIRMLAMACLDDMMMQNVRARVQAPGANGGLAEIAMLPANGVILSLKLYDDLRYTLHNMQAGEEPKLVLGGYLNMRAFGKVLRYYRQIRKHQRRYRDPEQLSKEILAKESPGHIYR